MRIQRSVREAKDEDENEEEGDSGGYLVARLLGTLILLVGMRWEGARWGARQALGGC